MCRSPPCDAVGCGCFTMCCKGVRSREVKGVSGLMQGRVAEVHVMRVWVVERTRGCVDKVFGTVIWIHILQGQGRVVCVMKMFTAMGDAQVI